jgi:hypothetical protein
MKETFFALKTTKITQFFLKNVLNRAFALIPQGPTQQKP